LLARNAKRALLVSLLEFLSVLVPGLLPALQVLGALGAPGVLGVLGASRQSSHYGSPPVLTSPDLRVAGRGFFEEYFGAWRGRKVYVSSEDIQLEACESGILILATNQSQIWPMNSVPAI
jgi:hypothetical protein